MHLLKSDTIAAQIRGFPREFVTLRVEKFVPKIAHLAILMGPRRPSAFGLLPRFIAPGYVYC